MVSTMLNVVGFARHSIPRKLPPKLEKARILSLSAILILVILGPHQASSVNIVGIQALQKPSINPCKYLGMYNMYLHTKNVVVHSLVIYLVLKTQTPGKARKVSTWSSAKLYKPSDLRFVHVENMLGVRQVPFETGWVFFCHTKW